MLITARVIFTTMAALVSIVPVALTVSKLLAQERRHGSNLDAEAIGKAAGTRAVSSEDGTVGIRWPRDDVTVVVDNMPIKPFAGLASVAAFHSSRHGAMVMGDMVVFQDEVSAAMDAAFENGLEVTALHNHFAFDEPKVYFMHIGGSGDALKLAAGVKSIWDAIKDVRSVSAQPADSFPGSTPDANGVPDAARIEQILGRRGRAQGGVVMITIGRTGRMDGTAIGESMGVSTTIAFAGTNENGVVYGDFIMTAAEVQPVLKTLRQDDIHIVALHNHMIGEQPPFFFAHFWRKGQIESLAAGMKAALDAQQATKTDVRR